MLRASFLCFSILFSLGFSVWGQPLFSESFKRDVELRYRADFSKLELSDWQEREKEQQFGQFVLRRWVDEHWRNFLQETPRLRAAQRWQEEVSRFSVQTKRGWSFSGRYLLAIDDLQFVVETGGPLQLRWSRPLLTSALSEVLQLSYRVSKNLITKTEYLVFSHETLYSAHWGYSF